MNQPPDKSRVSVILPGKADVLKHFTRHCAFVKVVVVLILTLPAIGISGAAALYAAHHVGLWKSARTYPAVHVAGVAPLLSAKADRVLPTSASTRTFRAQSGL